MDLEIRLERHAKLGIRATLWNRGNRALTILHSASLQPSRLLLKAAGKTIEPFDNRTRAKFDRTVHPAMFRPLPPGASLQLSTTDFRRSPDGSYEVQWGPFLYDEIPRGPVQIVVEFESVINAPTDGAPLPNAWTGKVASKPLELALP